MGDHLSRETSPAAGQRLRKGGGDGTLWGVSFVPRGMLRSPVSWVVVGGVTAILVAAVVDAVRPSSDPVEAAPRSALDTNGVTEGTTTESVAPTSDVCDSWSCWAQDVAIGAGYEVVGTTGSAWVVRGRKQDWHRNFYFWVTPGRAGGLGGDRGFPLIRRMGDVSIFGDGTRFAWRLRGATAWVEAVGTVALKLHTLNPLVATSNSLAALDPPG
jgi:hypothetical protein